MRFDACWPFLMGREPSHRLGRGAFVALTSRERSGTSRFPNALTAPNTPPQAAPKSSRHPLRQASFLPRRRGRPRSAVQAHRRFDQAPFDGLRVTLRASHRFDFSRDRLRRIRPEVIQPWQPRYQSDVC